MKVDEFSDAFNMKSFEDEEKDVDEVKEERKEAVTEEINSQEEKPKKEKIKKEKNPKKYLVFIVVLLTLFFSSFAVTSYVIMNANNLVVSKEGDADTKQHLDEIEDLKKQLAQRDKEIEELMETNVNSSAPSFSAPVVKQETQKNTTTSNSSTNKNTSTTTKKNNTTTSSSNNSTDKKSETSENNSSSENKNTTENKNDGRETQDQPIVDENEEVFE